VRVLSHIVAGLIGLGLAFFGVFNILFTDVTSTRSRVGSWAYVFILYGFAGLLGAEFWPRRGRAWILWLGVPALAVGLLVILTEPGTLLVDLAGAGLALAGLGLGAAVGGRLRAQERFRR
jgi:hypothetical protein